MNQYPSTKSLNIIKASLPFMNPDLRQHISTLVRAFECNNMCQEINNSLDETLSACSVSGNVPFNPSDLLYAIKPYLNGKEANTINTFMNIQTIMNMYQNMGNSGNFGNFGGAKENTNLMNMVQSMMGGNAFSNSSFVNNGTSSSTATSDDKLREDSIHALKGLLGNSSQNSK